MFRFSVATFVLLISLFVQCLATPTSTHFSSAEVVPSPDCSEQSIITAAMCKCALVDTFLPHDDTRLRSCYTAFGHDLSPMKHMCSRFSVGATSNPDLAAMFAIEKMGGKCFPQNPCKDGQSATSRVVIPSSTRPSWRVTFTFILTF